MAPKVWRCLHLLDGRLLIQSNFILFRQKSRTDLFSTSFVHKFLKNFFALTWHYFDDNLCLELPVVCVSSYEKIVETFQKDAEAYAGRITFNEFDRILIGKHKRKMHALCTRNNV